MNHSVEKEVCKSDNLIVLRSLSKDFGIAGLRLGYSVLNPTLRQVLFEKYGLLWNINGLAHFFIQTILKKKISRKDTLKARRIYLEGRSIFYSNLKKCKEIKVYPSKSNFFLVEKKENINEIFSKLLFEYGIYTRILNDKRDLDDLFSKSGNYQIK